MAKAVHWRECVVCGWYVNEKDEHIGTPPGKSHTPDPREITPPVQHSEYRPVEEK